MDNQLNTQHTEVQVLVAQTHEVCCSLFSNNSDSVNPLCLLRALEARLARQHAREENGFHGEVLRVSPHLLPRVNGAQREHRDLESQLASLRADAESVFRQAERFVSRLKAFRDDLQTHEERETDLFFELYWRDDGEVD